MQITSNAFLTETAQKETPVVAQKIRQLSLVVANDSTLTRKEQEACNRATD